MAERRFCCRARSVRERTMELLLLNRPLLGEASAELGTRERVVDDAGCSRSVGDRRAALATGATSAFGQTKRLVAHSLGALESHMVLESETIAAQAASVPKASRASALSSKSASRIFSRQRHAGGARMSMIRNDHSVCDRRRPSSWRASTSRCAACGRRTRPRAGTRR